MQYIPLAIFYDFLDEDIHVLTPEQRLASEQKIRQLYAAGRLLKVAGKTLSEEAVLAFVRCLEHPGAIVFAGSTVMLTRNATTMPSAEMMPNSARPV